MRGPGFARQLIINMLVSTIMNKWPYTVTFKADHPSRNQSDNSLARWTWLHANIGELGKAWDWTVPFVVTEDLVFYFGTPEDRTLFVLTWG